VADLQVIGRASHAADFRRLGQILRPQRLAAQKGLLAALRIARRRVIRCSSLPGSGALKPMPEPQIAQAVQLLDLMLEHLPTTATGRAAVMMTETAAIAWSALFCI
jgi:hypothetical protein